MASTKHLTPAQRKASKRIMRSDAYRSLQQRYKDETARHFKTRTERDSLTGILDSTKKKLDEVEEDNKTLRAKLAETRLEAKSLGEKLSATEQPKSTPVVDPNPKRSLESEANS